MAKIDTIKQGDNTTETTTYPNGRIEEITKDAKGALLSQKVTPAPIEVLTTSLNTIQDAMALMKALQGGQALPIVGSGLKVADDIGTLANGLPIPNLHAASSVVGAFISLNNLQKTLEHGTDLQKLTAVVGSISAVNNAMLLIPDLKHLASPALSTALNGTPAAPGGVLSYLSIANDIANGDGIGLAIDLIGLIPGWGQAAALALSIVRAITTEDPKLWGNAHVCFDSNGRIQVVSNGEGAGKERVQMALQSMVDLLQEDVDAANTHSDGSNQLGLIANRLPSLQWAEERFINDTKVGAGWALIDIDPTTGAQKYPLLRFNDGTTNLVDGLPYNADPTDPKQRGNLLSQFIEAARAHEAIGLKWEADTARIQTRLGEVNAGLTEEERAGRSGQLAVRNSDGSLDASRNHFRPVALDLNGDGSITQKSKDQAGVSFNWDDSGYFKQTGWIGGGEGFLFLDRNPNGAVDGGRELFSNGAVNDDAKGVRSLYWVDANGDGKIDAADPVYSELKVWQDGDGDGVLDAGEAKSLQDLGISELNYQQNRFTQNGSMKLMASDALETANDGVRLSVNADGIVLDYSDGKRQLAVTRYVNDRPTFAQVTSVGSPYATEGDKLDFVVTLDTINKSDTVLNLSLASLSGTLGTDTGAAQISLDNGATFTDLSGSAVTVPLGTAKVIVRVPTLNDAVNESLENIRLTASTSANASAMTGTGYIIDATQVQDETTPTISVVGPATVDEDAGTVTYIVSLSRASETTVSVAYSTADDTAAANADYSTASGVLSFDAGQTLKTVSVAIYKDALTETAEKFALNLSNALNATIANGTATTEIVDLGAGLSLNGELISLSEDAGDTSPTPNTSLRIDYETLLANDSFNSVYGSVSGIRITGLSNASKGQVHDTSEYIEFIPDANYAGDGAGFDYTVSAPDGSTRTARASFNITAVNDAPQATYAADSTAIYGYELLTTVSVVSINLYDGGSGSEFEYSVTPEQGKVINKPYVTLGVKLGSWVSLGDSGYLVFDGPTIDIGLSQAAWNDYVSSHQAGGEGYFVPTAIKLNGQTYEVQENVQYAHNQAVASEDADTGHVVPHDVDDADGFKFELLRDGLYGKVSLDAATGAYSYLGTRYVEYDPEGNYVGRNIDTNEHGRNDEKFVDTFTVRVWDKNGGADAKSHEVDVNVTHYGPRPNPNVMNGSSKKPIAIDLDGNGFEFTKVDDSNVFFDVNGDGWKHRTSWIGKNDALLAYDADGDGKIDKGTEISFLPYKEGAQTDLEGLRAFDTNGDGVFSAADKEWSKFGIWQDANSNGVTDPGEFKTLDNFGVASIGLSSDGKFQVINGQTVHGVASLNKTDGSSLKIADVSFSYSNEIRVTHLDGTETVVNKSAFAVGNLNMKGTTGNDLLLGTDGSDGVVADAGDDVVMGVKGNDYVDAGAGNDTVYTGADNDIVGAGTGDDVVFLGEGNDIVLGADGNDALFGEGGNDLLFGDIGNDFLSGGTGNDVVSGEAGDDQLFGEQGFDALFGGDGNDSLYGSEGDDVLNGGNGNDLLEGDVGNDDMTGGSGDDTYEVDAVGDKIAEKANEGLDTVRSSIDYVLADNLENLTLLGNGNINSTGNGGANVLKGNAGNNQLFGGSGGDMLDGGEGIDIMSGGTGDDSYLVDNAADVVIEGVAEGADTVRSGIDYVLGSNVENLVLTGTATSGTGNALNNRLTGNFANNILDGAAGADTMTGGAGDDTYLIDDADDRVIELSWEGNDTVDSAIDYVLGANLENIALVGTAKMATGNALNNSLVGNAGNNILDGGAGADSMAGGAGDDDFAVDNIGDQITELTAEGNDTVRSSVDYTLEANLENLVLTGTTVGGTGNALDNALTGNAGNNNLDGGAGADNMAGGIGDDTYSVDGLGDLVTEVSGEGQDTVRSAIDYALGANLENLVLTGTAVSGTGNELDNALTGNDYSNILDGGAGVDSMTGGAGDDVYVVDNPGDLVSEVNAEGVDTVQSSVDYRLGNNLENLVLTGAAVAGSGNTLNNAITANDLGNSLNGDAGNDDLSGGRGNDELDGGSGTDVMSGDAGDDTYVVDSVDDKVLEFLQGGTDSIFASVSYLLPEQTENLSLIGTADICATGNALDNVLTGNGGINVLNGDDGADSLTGGSGNDSMIGGAGDDHYFYNLGDGDDQIVDAAGVDSLHFGAGMSLNNLALRVQTVGVKKMAQIRVISDDIDIPVQGLDFEVTTDAQNRVISPIEKFLLSDGQQVSWDDLLIKQTTINGTNFSDKLVGGRNDDNIFGLNSDDTLSGGFGDDKLDGDNGDDVLYGGAGNDSLYGKNGNDKLYGGAGIDVLSGGNGIDYLDGGSGNDVLEGGNGDDTLFGGAGNDSMAAGNGKNFIDSGAGDDIITLSNSNNIVLAGCGNDKIGGDYGNKMADAGNHWLAGGKGNDTIDAGQGRNVFSFNRGDGADIYKNNRINGNVISLGMGIKYADLSLSKSGMDLILNLGEGDSITLKDWYSSPYPQGVDRLQVITEGGDYDADSSDKTKNSKVEVFDFSMLVQRFNASLAATPTIDQWAVMNGLLDAHLFGSNTSAIGGDLSYQYGVTGDISGIGLSALQASLAAADFNSNQGQTLHTNAQSGGITGWYDRNRDNRVY